MSILSSSLLSATTIRNSGLSISRGLTFLLVSIDSWLCKISLQTLQGWPSLKQWMSLSSDPTFARFKAHDLKDFLILSELISSHASRIQFTIARWDGGFKFPPDFNWLIPSSDNHWLYFSVARALKGLFQLTSRACIYFAHPPGTIDTLISFCKKWRICSIFNMKFIRVLYEITMTKWKSAKNFIHPSIAM